MRTPDSSRNLDRQLQHCLRRARLRLLVHGVLTGLVLGGGGALAAIWTLGSIADPPISTKIGLALCCVAALALSIYLGLIRPWLWLRNRSGLVRRLEQAGDFGNTLIAAEEALRVPDRWYRLPGVSAELVDRLLADAVRETERMPLGRLLQLRAAGRTLVGAGLLVAVLLLLVTGHPGLVGRGFQRLIHPWQRETVAASIGLYAEPGPGHVVAGRPAVVSALDFGVGDAGVVCEVRSGSGLWRRADCLPVPETDHRPYQRWEARLESVRESFFFRFRRGLRLTREREVAVWHPPLLTELSGRIEFPAYTRLAPQPLPRMPGYLEALAGSRLILTGRANHPVQWAAVVTAGGDSLPLVAAADSVYGELPVNEPLRYSVRLRDQRGLANETPLEFELAVARDMPPQARLVRPNDDGRLPVDGEVYLLAEGADDFGISRLDLLVRREEQPVTGPAGERPDDHWQRATVWRNGAPVAAEGQALAVRTELGRLRVRTQQSALGDNGLAVEQHLLADTGDLELVPGDVLALCLEAVDNRAPGPPATGRSKILRLTLPSAAEILVTQAEQRSESESDLEKIRRRSRSLTADLDRLGRELKKNPLPDWTRQQEIEQAIQRQQALQEELSSVAQQLQSDLAALADNHLTSSDLLDKMDQIAELLSQAQSSELQQLLDRLREAVTRLSSEEVADAVAEVTRNQKELVQRLDSALNMLKEAAREQELEGITSLLAKLIRKQQELADASRPQDEAGKPEDTAQEPGEQGAEGEHESGEESKSEDADAEDSDGEQGEKGEQGEQGEQTDQQPSGEPEGAAQESAEESAEELAERQKALAEELAQLEQQLAEALENLEQEMADGQQSPSSELMKDALEQALEKLQQEQTAQNMQKASQQLQQGQPGDASQQQQQALRDLGYLYHVLLSGQQGMQMAMQQHQVASLRRLAADLLALSQRQEEIAARIPSELRGIRYEDLTRGQHRVLKAGRGVRQRLEPLTTAAPMQIIRLLQKIDDLLETLGGSVQALENGRGKSARSYARNGLSEMNRIIIGLLTQAQMTGAGGGGGSPMPQMSQQLKELARQQASLNSRAQQLQQMMQRGGLSQEIRAQMQRLQGEQGDLAGRARDVAEQDRQQRSGDRLLGDMDHLAGEMEEVVSDLGAGGLSDETLARQERILSRLLDAHNSIRKRDFSSRRESKSGRQLYAEQHGDGGDRDDLDTDLPFRLRYQPVEKAPLEYRDLVRRYFRALDALHDELDDTRPESTRKRPGGEGQS